MTAFSNPIHHKIRSLEYLELWDMKNIHLKKVMTRRLFRILPEMRNIACSRLSAHALRDDYITMSVRRGDKALEFEIESSLQPYVDKAEIAIILGCHAKMITVLCKSLGSFDRIGHLLESVIMPRKIMDLSLQI